MKHRAWLVDLDGTLYHPIPVKVMLAAELLLGGSRAIAPLRAFRHEHERIRRDLREATDDPFVLQLERTAAHLGIAPAELSPIIREWMFRRPGRWIRRFRRRGLLSEIAAFRDAGGKTAIVSDYPAQEKLQALQALPLFDAVVANGEERGPGRLKPWPDGFELAARRLGVEPGLCLVIGDRADADGEAASRAGMAYRQIPGGTPTSVPDGEAG